MTENENEAIQWRQANPAFIAIQFLRNMRGLVVPLGFVLVSQGFRGGLSREGIFIWISPGPGRPSPPP